MEMSEDIYANTGVTADNKSDSDSYEAIYTNEDYRKTENTKEPERPVAVINSTGSRRYKVTVVCLGMLSILLLAVITAMCLRFIAERDQLQTKNNNLTTERDQLQIKYNNLTINRDQLQISNQDLRRVKDQLDNKMKQITDEKDNLQTSFNTMRNQRDQLQNEKDGFKRRVINCECRIMVGDQVRVKASVNSPKYAWGSVSHSSVGVVTAINGESMTVNFPEHQSWEAAAPEMELAASADKHCK